MADRTEANVGWKDEYASMLRAKGRSDATLVEVTQAFGMWEKFCAAHEPDDHTAENFMEWRKSGGGGRSKRPAMSTIKKGLRTLRAAWAWAKYKRYEPRNIFDDIDTRPARKTPEKTALPPREHVQKIIRFAEDEPELYALPLLCYYAGLKLHEAIEQRAADIRGGYVHVRAHKSLKLKRHQEATLPLADKAKVDLDRLARMAIQEGGLDARVVGFSKEPISRDKAYAAFARWSRQAGVSVRPSDLRETCGLVMADRGASPQQIQRFLRLRTLASAMRFYTAPGLEDAAKLLT